VLGHAARSREAATIRVSAGRRAHRAGERAHSFQDPVAQLRHRRRSTEALLYAAYRSFL